MDNRFTFRPNTCDYNVFTSVTAHDEYHIPYLQEQDVVIDIGAHIGSFSYHAYRRGSRAIYAFEANRENYEIAKEHLRGTGVQLSHNAVWHTEGTLHHSGFTQDGSELNTGGGNVFASEGMETRAIAINTLLDLFTKVKILKLDCEGSEWTILYHISPENLKKIAMITMEYHELSYLPIPMDVDIDRCNAPALQEYLREQGFSPIIVTKHGNTNLGKLYAYS